MGQMDLGQMVFLKLLGCFPKVCTHEVCGVFVRIFQSMVLYFCSNVSGVFIFVTFIIVFRATWSLRFSVFFYLVSPVLLCTLHLAYP